MYYKIGITSRLTSRMSCFRVNNPFEVEVLYWIECEKRKELETLLHNRFEKSNHWGKWFVLDSKDVKRIKEIMDYYALQFPIQ